MGFSSLSECVEDTECTPADAALPRLRHDEVLLFLFKPGPSAAGLRGLYESWLSTDETQRLRRFRFDQHRDEYLHGRALTRFVLSAYLGTDPGAIRFEHNRFGKPRIDAAPGLHFNLSHTKGINVLAVTRRGAIGVDLEFADPARAGEDISFRYFAKPEHQRLLAARPQDRPFSFFSTWTLKESFVKAVGQGLSLPLADFAFEFEGERLRLNIADQLATTRAWHSELLVAGPDLLCAWTLDATGDMPDSTMLELTPAACCTPLLAHVLARGGSTPAAGSRQPGLAVGCH